MKKLIISSVLMLVMLPSISSAQLRTGNDLYSLCTNRGGPETYACIAWFSAHRNTVYYVDQVLKVLGTQGPTKPFCIPQNVTTGQVKDVAVNYLRDNPETRHRDAVLLVGAALLRAWPCGR